MFIPDKKQQQKRGVKKIVVISFEQKITQNKKRIDF
jgi:hypothetical protein